MTDKLKQIVDRAGSTLTTKWRMFYRPYFNSDNECLNFIYSTIKDEQITDESIREVEPGIYELKDGRRIYDKDFIPRRMLNTVMRMVSAARDMEQIRRGKDVFKIVFLVTCVETLQKLSGEDSQKKKLLFDFFRGYTSEKAPFTTSITNACDLIEKGSTVYVLPLIMIIHFLNSPRCFSHSAWRIYYFYFVHTITSFLAILYLPD